MYIPKSLPKNMYVSDAILWFEIERQKAVLENCNESIRLIDLNIDKLHELQRLGFVRVEN